MKTLEITGNIGCINNCTYCPQELLIKSYTSTIKKMTFNNFKKYLSTVPKTTQIDFSGMSEIFQNDEAIEMILYTYEQNYPLLFYTTLVGLTMENLLKLKDIIFDNTIVLHLPDKDNLTKIKITPEYLKVLSKLVQIKMGSKIPISSNTYTEVHQKIIDSGIEHLNPISLQKNNFLISRGSNLDSLKIEKKLGKLVCGAGFGEHNILLPNGDVLLCCCDYSINYILGNLNIDTYEKIINSNKLKQLKEKINSNDIDIICRYCEKSVII